MRRLLIFSLFALFSFSSNSQNNGDISIGKIDSLESEILGENRKIWVHVPDTNPNSIYNKQNFPVIYLLDGPGHFTSVVGMMQHLSGSSIAPKMIVVGIPNTNRTRDLTPSKAKLDLPMVDERIVRDSGGGKKFMAFLEQELIPYIESNYPTQPYRILIGHSFGGLFALDVFLDKPELFNSYIAIDPSTWYDEEYLKRQVEETSFSNEAYNGKRLYVGIANTMDKGMDTISVRKDTSVVARQVRSNLEFRDALTQKNNKLFGYRSKYYEKDSHASVPLITTYDGLRYIYDYFQYEIPFEQMLNGDTSFIEEMKDHYKMVSKNLGYTVKPDEAFLNVMGYETLSRDLREVSEALFKLNIHYYPDSFNVYDSMGDYYVAVGNKELAKKSFEKVLTIHDYEPTKRKLARLMKD